MSRLTGAEMRAWENAETTLNDVRARILRTTEYLRSIDPASINGSEEREKALLDRGGAIARVQAPASMYGRITRATDLREAPSLVESAARAPVVAERQGRDV